MTFYTSMYLCIFESFSSDSFIWGFRQVMKKTHWWCLSNKNNFPNQICSMLFTAKPWGKTTDAIEFVLKSHNLSGGFPLTYYNLFISLEVKEESKREISLHTLCLFISYGYEFWKIILHSKHLPRKMFNVNFIMIFSDQRMISLIPCINDSNTFEYNRNKVVVPYFESLKPNEA